MSRHDMRGSDLCLDNWKLGDKILLAQNFSQINVNKPQSFALISNWDSSKIEFLETFVNLLITPRSGKDP